MGADQKIDRPFEAAPHRTKWVVVVVIWGWGGGGGQTVPQQRLQTR